MPDYDENKTYYVRVTAYARNPLQGTGRELTAFQSSALIIGKEPEVIVKPDKPILSSIGDKNIEIGSRVELAATVTNIDSAATYTYQWFEASSKTASGTPIANATSAKYAPATGKNGEKYYYCNVTVSKNGYTETTTTNRAKVRVTTPLSRATIGSIAAQTYTGKGITPSVTVKYNGITLTNGTDYTVSYSNHINPGTATVTITGKGYYTGSRVINFTIKEIKNGWVYDNGKWYYYSQNIKQTGWKYIGSKWYYMDNNGVMQTGWKYIGSNWYFFNESGDMRTGWFTRYGKTYYCKPDGSMARQFVKVGSSTYYFDSEGALQTGWKQVGNKWYYMNSNGVVQTGWKQLGKNWYYLNSDGSMQTGWKQVGRYWYYMDNNGVMQTGWKYIGKNWYYMDGNGVMQTGWKTINGKRYYFDSNGAMR